MNAPARHLSARPHALLPVLIVLFGLVLVGGSAPTAFANLSPADFDVVAFKWDSGEFATGSPIGVIASPSPVNEGAVNLMLLNDVIPLYITDGPTETGTVSFGFVDHTVWTPSNGDGNDIAVEFNSIGDRVYATVDPGGLIQLKSAADLSAGQVIASTTVTLDPDKALRLVIEPEFDWAYVFYDQEIIVEGNPFLGGITANRANLGTDMVISVGCLCDLETDTSSATINDRSRNAQLQVHEFPYVMPKTPYTGFDLRPARGGNILLADEAADLAIQLTNIGSETATGIDVTLSIPGGIGMSLVGLPTRSYGDLESGASTVRRFSILTSGTPVGVHELTLNVSGGVSQTLTTFVPVWESSVTISDTLGGVGQAILDTPYGQHVTDIVAPEVLDGNGDPDYFDIQHVTHHITHAQPYLGTHWGDMEMIGPAAPKAGASGTSSKMTGNITGTVAKLTSQGAGAGVQGAVVQLIAVPGGGVVSTDTTPANGSYALGPAPFGGYKLSVLLPVSLRKDRTPTMSGNFELGVPALVMADWLVVCPSPNSNTSTTAPPSNAQGGVGTPTTPPPAPPAAPPPPNGSGRAKSMAAGFGASTVVFLIDFGLGFETFGAAFLSFLAGSGAGAGVNLAVDPDDQDLFYVGEEMTPPLDAGELTLEETVDVSVSISPPISTTGSSSITTTFAYTRVTDKRTYTYNGGETLILDRYLPIALTTNHLPGADCGTVNITAAPTTSTGTPLRGPEVIVQAWLTDSARELMLGEALLRDDGQGNDTTAGDGIFSGSIAATCYPSSREVFTYALSSGFYPHNLPYGYGFATQFVNPLTDAPTPERPLVTALYPNVPNPFNPSTEIRFDLARAGRVNLSIYNLAGRKVRTLVSESLAPDTHRVIWDGTDEAGRRVSSGIYFYRLITSEYEETRRMALIK